MKLYSIDDFRIDNFAIDRYRLDNYRIDGVEGGGGTIIDHSTPVTVVNSAYDTSGNGGRKLVRLNSGNLYAAMRNGTSAWYIYKSTDNGGTWSLFKTVTVSVNDIALATNGTNIYAIISYSTSSVKCYAYNESGTVLVNGVNIDATQSTMGLCSLTIDSSGDLHAAWASKNSTYPNSFNIRYSKSTNGGATWATPTQLTTLNVSGRYNQNPCLLCLPEPIVFYEMKGESSYTIYASKWGGSSFLTAVTVYFNSSRTQANPCADIDETGQINCSWQGYGSTHTSTYHIFFKASTDNGATWGTLVDLSVGENPSIAHDEDNNLYVQYERGGKIYQKKSTDNGATWGVEAEIGTGANVSTCNNYDKFTQPLSIWKGTTNVLFAGVFTA